MKELVILSGKGGTGKTSVTAAFASLAKNMVLCDADVDAADLHLIMAPEIRKTTDFFGGGIAVIDNDKCSECGQCIELCRFEAIKEGFIVDEIACEGCGVCVDFCPEQAIDFPTQKCGQWYLSDTRFGPMVHAKLGIAEENSGKLVTLVKNEAKKLAKEEKKDLVITDGPPGIGCPVIASFGNVDAALIITEPTVSGLHDMERVADLAAHFKVTGMVCVNKYDLNMEQTKQIENLTKKKNMYFLGKIPFDSAFTASMVQGKTFFEYNGDSKAKNEVRQIWNKIIALPVMNMK
ncbi:MAG: (4Fe-4S)-binding protein [Deltaproteobacteria bacterium]|nr:MAG: (4Fe-4S)-binding protein [Deltaproteobacteria bacterium]